MAFVAVTTAFVLPWPLQSSLEAMARVLLEPGDRSHIDFSRPVGEAALLSPESVSWRVFKNPLSLFLGGVPPSHHLAPHPPSPPLPPSHPPLPPPPTRPPSP